MKEKKPIIVTGKTAIFLKKLVEAKKAKREAMKYAPQRDLTKYTPVG